MYQSEIIMNPWKLFLSIETFNFVMLDIYDFSSTCSPATINRVHGIVNFNHFLRERGGPR